MPVGSASVGTDPNRWLVRGAEIRTERPLILGVLNLTPDSFSDGGSYTDPAVALARAERMIAVVIGELARRGVPVSIDTTKSSVARRAVDAGAAVLNDVSGLRSDPALADVAAESGAGLILMHLRGTPRTMQRDVAYEDLVGEVMVFLGRSLEIAEHAGCDREQLVIDPGIGFGKSTQGNLQLIAGVGRLLDLGRPVMVGPSRKSFIGKILDVPIDERLEGTIGACVAALERGARVFRVHDVIEVRRALDLAWAVRTTGV
jgi:dihydropteroate synthase